MSKEDVMEIMAKKRAHFAAKNAYTMLAWRCDHLRPDGTPAISVREGYENGHKYCEYCDVRASVALRRIAAANSRGEAEDET